MNMIRKKQMKTINEIADAVHQLAWDKGWHSKSEGVDAFVERMCNNLHNEISEFHEAWRNNKLFEQCDKQIGLTCAEEELADLIIRALDNARKLGIDIQSAIEVKHNYNKMRSNRHGGKRS